MAAYDAVMDRRIIVLAVAVAALLAASIVFKVRVMVACGKYAIAAVVILLLVAAAAGMLKDRDR